MANKDNIRDYSTPYNFHVRNDLLTAEYQIAIEHMNIVREKLATCAMEETVNQFVNCKELKNQYLELCQDRYRGMLFPPGTGPANRQVPGLIAPKKNES